eukprot:8406590-Pyramimonas_sp.AAC.1
MAAQRMSQWKWLIVDEVSKVSANFLAELDSQLQSRMSAASGAEVGGDGVGRSFVGSNAFFFLGWDFHRLEPPSGAAISALPASHLTNARKCAPGAAKSH